MYSFFGPPPPLCLQAEPVRPSCSPISRRKDNNKKILLVWDKNSYIGVILVLFPCRYVLQPKVVHLYQISSLLPSPLPIVFLASLRLLYLILYSEHINHI
jgi:hypothetical protein